MLLLLDTHAFLWLVAGDPRLSETAARAISNPDARVFVSSATAWEIVIKQRLGKLSLSRPVSEWWDRSIARLNIEVLSVTADDVFAIEPLALHHRDPFDRLLIAQAIRHGLRLVSTDEAFSAYPVETVW